MRQPPPVVFVIDTTGSMFEEISAVRERAYSIIQAREHGNVHTLPGTFLLVPFHDPGMFHSLTSTDFHSLPQFNSRVAKGKINYFCRRWIGSAVVLKGSE